MRNHFEYVVLIITYKNVSCGDTSAHGHTSGF
jgi:hypothetical protein